MSLTYDLDENVQNKYQISHHLDACKHVNMHEFIWNFFFFWLQFLRYLLRQNVLQSSDYLNIGFIII